MGVDCAFVHVDQIEALSTGSFGRSSCVFLGEPVQHVVGRRHRRPILPMRQIMAWTS
jgi:hypothetical protein